MGERNPWRGVLLFWLLAVVVAIEAIRAVVWIVEKL